MFVQRKSTRSPIEEVTQVLTSLYLFSPANSLSLASGPYEASVENQGLRMQLLFSVLPFRWVTSGHLCLILKTKQPQTHLSKRLWWLILTGNLKTRHLGSGHLKLTVGNYAN